MKRICRVFILLIALVSLIACNGNADSSPTIQAISKVAFILGGPSKSLSAQIIESDIDTWRYTARPMFSTDVVLGVKNPTQVNLVNNYAEVNGNFAEGQWYFELYGYSRGICVFQASTYQNLDASKENAVQFSAYDKNSGRGRISVDFTTPQYSATSTYATFEYRKLGTSDTFMIMGLLNEKAPNNRMHFSGTSGLIECGQYECIAKVYTNAVVISSQRTVVDVIGNTTCLISGAIESGEYVDEGLDITLSGDVHGVLSADKTICPKGNTITFTFTSTGKTIPDQVIWFVEAGSRVSQSITLPYGQSYSYSPSYDGLYIVTCIASKGSFGCSESLEFSTK